MAGAQVHAQEPAALREGDRQLLEGVGGQPGLPQDPQGRQVPQGVLSQVGGRGRELRTLDGGQPDRVLHRLRVDRGNGIPQHLDAEFPEGGPEPEGSVLGRKQGGAGQPHQSVAGLLPEARAGPVAAFQLRHACMGIATPRPRRQDQTRPAVPELRLEPLPDPARPEVRGRVGVAELQDPHDPVAADRFQLPQACEEGGQNLGVLEPRPGKRLHGHRLPGLLLLRQRRRWEAKAGRKPQQQQTLDHAESGGREAHWGDLPTQSPCSIATLAGSSVMMVRPSRVLKT